MQLEPVMAFLTFLCLQAGLFTPPADDRSGIEPPGGQYISQANALAADSPAQCYSQRTCLRSGMSQAEINVGEGGKKRMKNTSKISRWRSESCLSHDCAGSKAFTHRTTHHDEEGNHPYKRLMVGFLPQRPDGEWIFGLF